MAFFFEFVIINFEKQFFPMLDSSTWLQPLLVRSRLARWIAYLCGKIYYLIFLPHCFLPFVLLKSKKYLPVMLNLYCPIILVFGTYILWRPLAKFILRPEKKRHDWEEEAMALLSTNNITIEDLIFEVIKRPVYYSLKINSINYSELKLLSLSSTSFNWKFLNTRSRINWFSSCFISLKYLIGQFIYLW